MLGQVLVLWPHHAAVTCFVYRLTTRMFTSAWISQRYSFSQTQALQFGWTCDVVPSKRKDIYQSPIICFWRSFAIGLQQVLDCRKGVSWASFRTEDFLFAFIKVFKSYTGLFPPNMCVWETRIGQQKRGFQGALGAGTWYDPFVTILNELIDVTTSNRLNYFCPAWCWALLFFETSLWSLVFLLLAAHEKMCRQCVGKIFPPCVFDTFAVEFQCCGRRIAFSAKNSLSRFVDALCESEGTWLECIGMFCTVYWE